LAAANPALRLGGPGGQGNLNDLTKAFLAHCDTGTNYFTKQKGVRLDFISFHEKGAPCCVEDIDPDTRGICDREIRFIEYVRQNHPRLARIPMMNNECDPQIGWDHKHTWHGTAYYPALTAKIINQHQVRIIDGLACDYRLLSNDNGFTGGWGQRTLLTRFGSPNNLAQGHFSFVKKPIFHLMVLLSKLGDSRLQVAGEGDADSPLGILATRRGSSQIVILLYNSRDTIRADGCDRVCLDLVGVPFSRAVLAHYRIDADHTNPFAAYVKRGPRPDCRPHDLAAVRAAQELDYLVPVRETAISDGKLSLEFELPLPGVSAIVLSASTGEIPARVEGVRVHHYPGCVHSDKTYEATYRESSAALDEGETEEVLILWNDMDSYTLMTYEVLASESREGPFIRINDRDILNAAFLEVRPVSSAARFYKVRAMDFWGRRGEESEVTP
jgi:L-iduronidase